MTSLPFVVCSMRGHLAIRLCELKSRAVFYTAVSPNFEVSHMAHLS